MGAAAVGGGRGRTELGRGCLPRSLPRARARPPPPSLPSLPRPRPRPIRCALSGSGGCRALRSPAPWPSRSCWSLARSSQGQALLRTVSRGAGGGPGGGAGLRQPEGPGPGLRGMPEPGAGGRAEARRRLVESGGVAVVRARGAGDRSAAWGSWLPRSWSSGGGSGEGGGRRAFEFEPAEGCWWRENRAPRALTPGIPPGPRNTSDSLENGRRGELG